MDRNANEKNFGNGENTGNQDFLLFPQCFLVSERKFSQTAPQV